MEAADIQFHYREKFDAREYHNFLAQLSPASSEPDEIETFQLGSLHKLFNSDIVSKLTKKKFLELGTGADITHIISASKHFSQIYLSDISKDCRSELMKWKSNDTGALNFDEPMKYVSGLENDLDVATLQQRVRDSVVDVIYCDVLLKNPIEPRNEKFGVVLSSECFVCAANDITTFSSCVGNAADLLTGDGCLVLLGHSGTRQYVNNGATLPVLNITDPDVEKCLRENNLETLTHETKTIKLDGYPDDERVSNDNEMTFHVIVARKANK